MSTLLDRSAQTRWSPKLKPSWEWNVILMSFLAAVDQQQIIIQAMVPLLLHELGMAATQKVAMRT